MADRTSAEVFRAIFELLAGEPPSDTRTRLTRGVWSLARNYDFSTCQMDADDALMKLGLARLAVDPRYPNEGEVMVYGPTPTGGGET